jgi:hypothetical protein
MVNELFNLTDSGCSFVCECHMSLIESVIIFIITIAFWELFKIVYKHLFGAKLYKEGKPKDDDADPW